MAKSTSPFSLGKAPVNFTVTTATLGGYIDGIDDALAGGGGGIPATIFDAKGDLIAATAADTAARLPVGTNGQILTAASGEATGLEWATSAAGASDQVTIVVHASGDMRATIQTALDAAETAYAGDGVARIVRLQNGEVYLIDSFVTHSYRANGRAGVLVGEGVWFDLNGSTLKAGDSTNMWTCATKNPLAGTPEENIRVYGGVFDGNKDNQSLAAAAGFEEFGSLLFQNVDKGVASNLDFYESTFYAAEFLDCTACTFDGLRMFGGNADGFRFGVGDVTVDACADCLIDHIYTQDTPNGVMDYTPVGRSDPQGNGVVAHLTNCQIGSIRTINAGGGIKIDIGEGLQAGLLYFDGAGGNGTLNCGVKIQGSGDSLDVERIVVQSVVSLNCQAEGLRYTECKNAMVVSYMGFNNALAVAARDEIRVEAGPNSLGTGHIIESNADRGLLVDDTAPFAPIFYFGTLIVDDCQGNANGAMDIIENNAAGGQIYGDKLAFLNCAANTDAIDMNQAGQAYVTLITSDTTEAIGAITEGSTVTVGQYINSNGPQ